MAAVPPGVRRATSRGYRAAVAWNASHIVAGEPTSAIGASPLLRRRAGWMLTCSARPPLAIGTWTGFARIGPGQSGTTRRTGAAHGHGPSFGPGLIPVHP